MICHQHRQIQTALGLKQLIWNDKPPQLINVRHNLFMPVCFPLLPSTFVRPPWVFMSYGIAEGLSLILSLFYIVMCRLRGMWSRKNEIGWKRRVISEQCRWCCVHSLDPSWDAARSADWDSCTVPSLWKLVWSHVGYRCTGAQLIPTSSGDNEDLCTHLKVWIYIFFLV